MDILFLSSLCSVREYERMFRAYGSTSSHASQKFNRLFVAGLAENDCRVETLTQRIILNGGEDDLHCKPEVEQGIRFTYIPRKSNPKQNRTSTITYAYRYILNWTKLHPNGAVVCDIILGELSIAVFFASRVKKFKRIAVVTDVPSIRAGEVRKGIKAIPLKIKNKLIAVYDGYVFLTEQMNLELNKKKKPYVVVEGFADDKVIDIPNTMEGKYSEKVIMMAGLLEDIYGVDTLLEGFMQVDCPDARLRFYGKGASVKKINEASKIDDRISYCGELTNSEIVKEEKKATLLINPRPSTGKWTAYSFPSKNMEYMASGTPLAAFDLPCIPDEYKKYFLQLIPDTRQTFTESLELILNKDKEELHSFGLRAQNWIVKNKNPIMQTRKIVQMLNNVR